MKVLVTGTDGYIGAVLAPYLLARGLEVVGLDTGFYKEGWLYSDNSSLGISPLTWNRDLRKIEPADLSGFDGVVHLAELSNDPLGQNRPEVTFDINHRGSVRLATAAHAAGVERFVYTSSCSVYGAGSADFVDEQGAVNPQTAYAECKVLVEHDVGQLADERFSPVFLRNATVHGPSPRMRFDIVINDLCALAWTTGKIAMISDGSPWRPMVHILDVCEAIYRSLVAPADSVKGKVFNVGRNSDNFRVRELAEIVAQRFTGCEVSAGPPSGDNRSYRVSFDRIHNELPGFECKREVKDGVAELHTLFERIRFTSEIHRSRPFTRLRQLSHLLETGQLDPDLYWT